jgi:putative Holliday junction resolvase
LGVTAQGLETFDIKFGDFFSHLDGLFAHYRIDEVVMGHPVSMSGRASKASRSAEAMAGRIRRRFGVPVVLWDERLTSVEARRTLEGSRSDKKAVDRIAAVLILQSYLDSRLRGSEDQSESEGG